MGKGSSPRPIPNRKQFEDNWDRIFKKKEKTDDESLTDVVKERQNGETVKVDIEDL